MDRDALEERLVRIAMKHTRLALEHSRAECSASRKDDIKLEIVELRLERKCLMRLIGRVK